MATNYLPFARRSFVTVSVESHTYAGGITLYRMGRAATRISELAYGRGVRAHLGELEVRMGNALWTEPTFVPDVFNALSMRIGILGRGYLTENFHPINGYNNGPTHECGAWHFPKPYTVFPGQRLSAKFTSNSIAVQKNVRAAVQYNGKRVLDGKPIMLWDTADTTATAAGQTFMLNGPTLQCPADSPVELYSVTGPYDAYMHELDFYTWSQMLYYADGSKMWENENWALMMDIKNNCIDLNKPQWIMKPDEILTLEFEILPDPGLTVATIDDEHVEMLVETLDIQVTLRGSLEVQQ